ncbi:flagellar biosynthesis protein FlgN [Acetomicrobium sp.]|jgi:Zn-dependent oligopeptidase|uniref:flagellar biosynthesis protein FlgN n=1 Tax=Acetomicrobium sp. TaxID=1872099 RepID=UPI003D97061C
MAKLGRRGVLILQVNVDNIKGLAEKEQKLYRDLISLVDEEMEHARAGNTMALMDVLKRKQAVISCQEALQDKWLEFAASMGISSSRETVEFWDALAARLGKEGSKDVIEKIIEIRKMAAEILEKEYEVQKELESQLAKLRSNLLKLNDGMRAFKAYMS